MVDHSLQSDWAKHKLNQPRPGSRRLEQKSGEEEWLTPVAQGENTPFEQAVAIALLLAWFGAIWAMPTVLVVVCYYAAKLNPYAWAYIALMGGLSLLPAGKVWPAFRYSWVWTTWHRYFKLHFVHPALPFLEPDKHYLVVQFPHAVYPMACWLAYSFVGTQGSGVTDDLAAGIADVFFRLPIIKHNYAWAGSVSAAKPGLLKLLKKRTVALMPEGIAGIFLGASVEREAIFISRRKGFVKLAIEAGVDIIPTYSLGASQLLTFWGPVWLSRKLQTSVGIFWGRGFTPIPRPHPLTTLVGRPIPVKQSDKPSQEQVKAVHAEVVAALEKMYYRHRHLMKGFEDRPLHIN